MLRWIPMMLLLLGTVRGAVATDDGEDYGEALVRRALDAMGLDGDLPRLARLSEDVSSSG